MTYTVQRDARLLGATAVAREGDTGSRVWVSARDAKRLEVWDAGVRVGGVAVGKCGQVVFNDGASAFPPGLSLYPQDAAYICSGDSSGASQYAGRYLAKWPLQSGFTATEGFANTALVQDVAGTGTTAFATLGGKSCLIASTFYANIRNVSDLTYRSTGYTFCYSFYAQTSNPQQQTSLSGGGSTSISQDATNLTYAADSGVASTTIGKLAGVGAWEHYAITVDGTLGNAKLYRNGAQVSTMSAGVACRQRLGVTFQVNVGINAFRNVRLYSKVLTAAEVAAVSVEDLA